MIIEISVAVIAVAFVVLVIYIITLIKTLRFTLHQIDLITIDVRKNLDEVGVDAKKIIEHTQFISGDLKQKMDSLSAIFNTFSNIGQIAEYKTSILKKEYASALNEHTFSELKESENESRIHHHEINVADILELASISVRLCQKLKHKYSPKAKIKEKETI